MAQQINLFMPSLLAPRRHFPARSMAIALGLWLLALALLCGWAAWRSAALRADVAAAAASASAERRQLEQDLARREARSADPAVLKQELTALQARLAERERLLVELGGAVGDASPAPLLTQLARDLPAPVWLSDIRWAPGSLALAGHTLAPEALQAWIEGLGTGATLEVDRAADGSGRWSFRIARGRLAEGAPR